MDSESNVPDAVPMVAPQVSIVNYPNRATVWACKQLDNIESPSLEATKNDIRGALNNIYVYPNRGNNVHELVLIVFSTIDWDFVFNYYRTEVCKQTNNDM